MKFGGVGSWDGTKQQQQASGAKPLIICMYIYIEIYMCIYMHICNTYIYMYVCRV